MINNGYPWRLISCLPTKTIIRCGCMLTAEVAIMEARIARAINRLSEDGMDLLSGSDDLMGEYFDCDDPEGKVLRPSIIIITIIIK